jgi:Type I phosphodiesterase / nucleotide pyrophosphatase
VKHHRNVKLAALAVLLPACSSAGPEIPSPEAVGSMSADISASQDVATSTPQSQIQHVIYVQFDNTHLTRDNPNVPSDLEQMPNLLNFLERQGTVVSHHHTPLISHTADDIITSLTGVYPDKHGIAVANSYGYFLPTQTTTSFDGFTSAFAYWTNPISTSDPSFNLVTADGHNAPAPWVAWTRAGFNVGAVSIADMEFENVTSDINNVFGPTSPQAAEAKSNRTKAIADFEGIAVHCAAGSAVCSAANGGQTDVLAQEPGGYSGYDALFGHALVAPVISPGGPLVDLDGNLITDGHGNNGFPGFGGISAAQTLAYVAAMQEHGVAVTYAYISDAHDDHAMSQASGPGQADYVAQLAAYNEAFGKFFARLASDGITKDNTLFVFTADEGDHFAGGPPSPANCDGVTTPCTYAKIGEIDTNLTDLLHQADPSLASTPFDIHFDMAPSVYIEGNPAPGAPVARSFERAAAGLTTTSVITGNVDQLTEFLADPVEMKFLHMVTGDPQRTPSFVLFGDPDYFFQTSGSPDFVENSGFAWNHGGTNPEITTTWLGMVGPGVQNRGVDDDTWSDHTDIRPTMLLLAGLKDDYGHDGRALIEDLKLGALPRTMVGGGRDVAFRLLAAAYKQINAPVGALGMATLAASTTALAGDDTTYVTIEGQISGWTTQRDALAAQIIALLEGAEFGGATLDTGAALRLTAQAAKLLAQVKAATH